MGSARYELHNLRDSGRMETWQNEDWAVFPAGVPRILDYQLVRFSCVFFKISYNISRYNFIAWIYFLHREYWFIILISYFERRLFVSWPILPLNAAKLDPRNNVRYNRLAVLCEKNNLIFELFFFSFFFLSSSFSFSNLVHSMKHLI